MSIIIKVGFQYFTVPSVKEAQAVISGLSNAVNLMECDYRLSKLAQQKHGSDLYVSPDQDGVASVLMGKNTPMSLKMFKQLEAEYERDNAKPADKETTQRSIAQIEAILGDDAA